MMKARSFLALASLIATPILGAACAPEAPNAADEAQTQGDAALSATTRAYVTLKRDLRKCASPMCGGWFATDVNKKNAAPRYVAGLDFSSSGLDDVTAALVTGAPDGEVVVYGKLSAAGAQGTRDLVVAAAYRGMPDIAPAAGDTFYSVSARSPQIQCFAAPCDNLTAHKLNSVAKTNYTSTAMNLGHFIQTDWLTESVEDDGAIVVGTIANGAHEAGGYDQVLTASQVFLKLPETTGPCPELPVKQCAAGEVMTFTRTADRCLVPQGCVAQHPCPLFLPYCGPDYSSQSWVRENGCSMVSCDPAWLYPGQ